jgi:addiction module RelE/StbE family toxin
MRLRWTEPAAQDLTRICDYIEAQSGPAAARKVALTIYEGVSSLIDFPKRGRPGKQVDTRELVITRLPYIVVYRLRESTVEVFRILHGAQRWP